MAANTKAKLWTLAAVLILTAAGMAGFIAWNLRGYQPERPQISAFSHGRLVTVPPYMFCSVLLKDCDPQGHTVQLAVNAIDPVQLSIPQEIAKTPWRLVRAYANPAYPDRPVQHGTTYLGGSTLAVTVPTIDKTGLRLIGLAVQRLTIGITSTGEEVSVPHAEWSVATVWD